MKFSSRFPEGYGQEEERSPTLCGHCLPSTSGALLCPKHAAVDRLIEALDMLVALYPTHQTREWNTARALLDELREPTK